MLCEFVVIAFLSSLSIPDQITFVQQQQALYYREFLAENEWLLTYPDAQAGSIVITNVLHQKENDSRSPIDYVECLQPDTHHRRYRD